MSSEEEILTINNVVKKFVLSKASFLGRLRKHGIRYLNAVDGISVSVKKGETLVLLGESGSGKTTLGRLICGLERIDSGNILLNRKEVRHVRSRGSSRGLAQMVFQDPGASLDPFMSINSCVGEPLRKLKISKMEKNAKVREALKLVGLDETYGTRRTRELSGGQKQRVAVARAIVSDPLLIVLDEPTSSIDVSIQAQVLNMLVKIQKMKGFTYVLITHDPNVARYMADNIAVMHRGKLMEYGPTLKILDAPEDPYTKSLLSSAPRLMAR